MYSKSLYIGREQDAGAARFDPDIEVESVFQKMDVSVSDHSEKFSGNFEIVGVNDAVLDGEGGFCLAREAVSSARNDGGDQL